MNPFLTFNPLDRPSTYLALSEDEFADVLREHGWSEHGIEVELRDLRDYKERFKLNPVIIEDDDEMDAVLAGAILRRRSRRKGDVDGDQESD